MSKIKVAVMFGGKSSEHDVSKMSAESVLKNIDRNQFDVVPVEIDKGGEFDIDLALKSDIIFPVLHGFGGEDGSVQGFCETVGKPYVGCGVEASAIGLDKIAQKLIFKSLNFPIPSFQFFSKLEWKENPELVMRNIVPPVFIKPSHTGSSVGINKVKNGSEIKHAVDEALKHEDRIIVEEALDDIREIEVSVLGNEDLTVSVLGEIVPADEFYSYKAKYELESKLVIPANLSKAKSEEIQELAKNVYRALNCSGMSRVDFFVERHGSEKIYINEINTIPGFTNISMYPKLLEASGVSYSELLTRLIKLGLERKI